MRRWLYILWYLTDELDVLSLFDNTVLLDIKKKIVEAVKTLQGMNSKVKRFKID